MKIIAAKLENGAYIPSEELPKGILTVFNGENYTVYEFGDTLPEQPINEPIEPTQEDLQAEAKDLMAQLKEVMEKLK